MDTVPKGLQLSYGTLATIHMWLVVMQMTFTLSALGISSLKPVSFSIEKRAADCNVTVIGHGCQDKGLCYYEKCIKKHLSHTTCKVYGLFLRQDVDHGFGYNSSGIGQ